MLVHADMGRALEHQMLEEMRETGMAGQFVLRPDVIPNLQGNDWVGVFFEQHHLEPIR